MPTLQLVERLRLQPHEVEGAVDLARNFLRSRGISRAFWMIGDSSTPADLESRLRAYGMTTNEQPPLEAEQVAMALVSPPAAERPKNIQAGPVQSLDDALAAADVTAEVFGFAADQGAAAHDVARRSFEYARRR